MTRKDEFLSLYKKDFEITGGSKMETFLGMVVELLEQDDKSIKIHFDSYVKEVIANTWAISRNRCDPRRYRYPRAQHSGPKIFPNFPSFPTRPYKSITVQSFSLLQHGSDLIFHLRYHSWHVSVHRRIWRNGQLYTISWNILLHTPA